MKNLYTFKGKVKDLLPDIKQRMDDELEVQGDIAAEREAEDLEANEQEDENDD